MFLDDTACNLASLNLVKFLRPDGSFDITSFKTAVRILIIAQDILVDLAGYPTEKIARNSHDFRPLGLGYANLGALLLELGMPYDSEEGRNYAASITALMGGIAHGRNSLYVARLPAVISKQTPQRCNGPRQRVFGDGVVVPYRIQKLVFCDQPVGITKQEEQYSKRLLSDLHISECENKALMLRHKFVTPFQGMIMNPS